VHEARDFTPWLLENADAIAEMLALDIELSAAEHPVGPFSLDLIGRDNTNDCVLIVENQLTPTDHGHLGQLLTYAAGTEARTIVRMATDFREEHRQALDFLNFLGGENARFFGVQIGVVRIGESRPAPLFSLRAQPNDWASQTAAKAKVVSAQAGKGPLYVEFWSSFLDRIHAEHPGWTKARTPGASNWLDLFWLRPGVRINMGFRSQQRFGAELYIDTGDADENRAIFDQLLAQRPEIEQAYGRSLLWEEMEGKRACRLDDYRPGEVTQIDHYDEYTDWAFDAYRRFRRAVGPILGQPVSDSNSFGLVSDANPTMSIADAPI
jgi:hypothetical protein